MSHLDPGPQDHPSNTAEFDDAVDVARPGRPAATAAPHGACAGLWGTMRRFASRRAGDGSSGTHWDYDGPGGPMTVVIGRSGDPTTVSGPQVGQGHLLWDRNRLDRLDRLERGIEVTIGDERIRLWRASGGFSRRTRAIHVERSGQSARMRLRRWDTFSLEGTSVLVRGQLYRGRVADDAQPVDVALFLLMTASILSFEVR